MAGDQLVSEFAATPTRQRHTRRGRQVAGQFFDLSDNQRGKRFGVDPNDDDRPVRRSLPRRTVSSTSRPCSRSRSPVQRSRHCRGRCRPTARSWHAEHHVAQQCVCGPLLPDDRVHQRSTRSRTGWTGTSRLPTATRPPSRLPPPLPKDYTHVIPRTTTKSALGRLAQNWLGLSATLVECFGW